MTKRFLALVVCLSTTVFFGGTAAHASPTVYPDCRDYSNQFGAFEFTYDTTSRKAYAVSGASGHMLICGAAPDPLPTDCDNGVDTMSDYSHLYYPPGTRITDTEQTTVPEDSYVGSSNASFVGVLVCDGYYTYDPGQKLRAVDPDKADAQPDCADSAEGEVTACYKVVSDSIFLSYMAVRRVHQDGQERLRLELNKPKTGSGVYSLAEMSFTVCNYFGSTQSQRCGPLSGVPVIYNGSPSDPDCADGSSGIFRLAVHRPLNDGEWSGDATLCEPWVKGGLTDFRSAYFRNFRITQ